ncbi:MAG: ABC transporter permease [Pseudomonadota bacterium]|nr:ABC transporter permease [Pseudomonadota bacterium]
MQLKNIATLGVKELYSMKADPVLLLLIVYIFSFAVYTIAKGVNFEVKNASVAVVDDDDSPLSRELIASLLEPEFQPPVRIPASRMEEVLNQGEYVFVIVFPPDFERDVLSGKQPEIQINIDASAMTLAGNGAVYLQEIFLAGTIRYLSPATSYESLLPLSFTVRKLFNPNSKSAWFNSMMQVINSVTILGMILTGAALIREREHGTVEHLLVMPVSPAEIMLAKIWANGLIILLATLLSLKLVVNGVLDVPIQGSVLLFSLASILFLFSVTSLGILLATLTHSMAQFALLVLPVIIIMYLLSGGTTPLESMPDWLQWTMQASPSTHFVKLAQNILYRGAGPEAVWPSLLVLIVLGVIFYSIALARFRKAIVTMA